MSYKYCWDTYDKGRATIEDEYFKQFMEHFYSAELKPKTKRKGYDPIPFRINHDGRLYLTAIDLMAANENLKDFFLEFEKCFKYDTCAGIYWFEPNV